MSFISENTFGSSYRRFERKTVHPVARRIAHFDCLGRNQRLSARSNANRRAPFR